MSVRLCPLLSVKPWEVALFFFNLAEPHFPYLKNGKNIFYPLERTGYDDVYIVLVPFLEHRNYSVNINFCCQNEFSAPTVFFLPLCLCACCFFCLLFPYPGELLLILEESFHWSSTLMLSLIFQNKVSCPYLGFSLYLLLFNMLRTFYNHVFMCLASQLGSAGVQDLM